MGMGIITENGKIRIYNAKTHESVKYTANNTIWIDELKAKYKIEHNCTETKNGEIVDLKTGEILSIDDMQSWIKDRLIQQNALYLTRKDIGTMELAEIKKIRQKYNMYPTARCDMQGRPKTMMCEQFPSKDCPVDEWQAIRTQAMDEFRENKNKNIFVTLDYDTQQKIWRFSITFYQNLVEQIYKNPQTCEDFWEIEKNKELYRAHGIMLTQEGKRA